MRKILLTVCICIISFCTTTAQKEKKQQLTKSSVVKDSSGTIMPYDIWAQLVSTGHYKIKPQDKANDEFIIFRLSDEEYEKNLESMPKPKESNFFRTGGKFLHFKTTDINDKKINTKKLTGKIIVLNFWFINCPPCRSEIPQLNILADTYKSDSSIVFLAIALDQKYDLQQFLKDTRFEYTVLDNGRFLTDQYKITLFPTNVIVDQKGKIYFHSSGLAMNTVHWLKKSIEELKGKSFARLALPTNQ